MSFEMRHAPEVVNKLAKMWIATGRDVVALVEGIQETYEEYYKAKAAPIDKKPFSQILTQIIESPDE